MKFLGAFLECLLGLIFIGGVVLVLSITRIPLEFVGNSLWIYLPLFTALFMAVAIGVNCIIDAFRRGNK